LRNAVPGLIELLKHDNPTIRGDAASVLALIGDASASKGLHELLQDEHREVREAAREALDSIEGKETE
jgi:HEAT repeat protein